MHSLQPSTSGRGLPDVWSPVTRSAPLWRVQGRQVLRKADLHVSCKAHRILSVSSGDQSDKELEKSIQAGLDEQERKNAENKKKAQEYSKLNDQIEALAGEVREQLQGTSIYLVGMMGSGKSTVGKLVARALKYPFLDSDQIAEQQAEVPISQIFAEEGEESFRELESAVLQELMPFRSCVVATGGGAVTRRKNWGYMQHGIVVWLEGPPELLARRVSEQDAGTRPLLGGEQTSEADAKETVEATQTKLAAILDRRKDQYAQADLRVPLTDSRNALGAPVSVVAYRLLKALNDRVKKDKKEEPGSRAPEYKGFGRD